MSLNRILKHDRLTSILKDYSKKVGPATRNRERQEGFKDALTFIDHHDELYTETDIKTQTITWTIGIDKCLGYAVPKPGTRANYIAELVHPVLKDWYAWYINAATIAFTEKKTANVNSRFVIHVPVKKENGEYVLIKQMSIPFGKDQSKKLVTFLNSHTVVGPYRGEPLRPGIYEGSEKTQDGTFQRIEELMLPCMHVTTGRNLTDAFFSVIDQIRKIREAGENPDSPEAWENYTNHKGEPIAHETVRSYFRQIRKRLEYLLMHETFTRTDKAFLHYFETPLQFIAFFDESGMIDLLKKYADKPI